MRRLALRLPLLALRLPLLALAAAPARAEDPATNATPSFSRRVTLDGFGSAEIAPGWRISYGPDEATLDGIPKWSVCVYETAAPLDNRLLPERWHGLQPCEIAPALVPTNEVRVLPVRGKPWLLRLSLEGIGIADGKNVRGEVAMNFHRPATDAPAASESHAENAESAEPEPHAESTDDGWSFAFPEEPTLGKRLAVERILLEEAVGFENEIPAEAARRIRALLGTPHARLGSGFLHDAWFFPDGSTLHLGDGPSPRVVWK